jgi:hypothetical protein
MRYVWIMGAVTVALACSAARAQFEAARVEVSYDGHEIVTVQPAVTDGLVIYRARGAPYGTAPNWQNAIRRQVGGLEVADMNGDGLNDVVVGCYISNSYPPYTDWENLIYYNTGTQLEASPSWVSTDEVSTGDVQVADLNRDGYPDIFAANGSGSAAVVYFGGATGPSPTPGWFSAIPGNAWMTYAKPFDIDHDGDLDVLTTNQGFSTSDPYRPMYLFRNNAGVLQTVPSWQSAESSIQNFLSFADYDGDGWEDVAVSKWANFASGIYKNAGGTLQTTPVWTTGNNDTDKGVAWADVDHNGWPDLALGHSPTLLYSNTAGTLTQTWAATAAYFGHSELRFYDVDRDGDQDLIEIHFSNGMTNLYLNRNGVLDSAPSWSYDAAPVGTALALGDINGDKWPDLVLGYSGQPCVVVFYAQIPDIPGDFDHDGSVDVEDLAVLAQCLAGPGNPNVGCTPEGFAETDLDTDGDVDLADYAMFQPLAT